MRAALRGERMGSAYGVPARGIAGNMPSSLGNNIHIDEVLRAADEIQDEDPTVARILCEHAYALAQNLDPNSEGRGVLQFKTGLMSVIRAAESTTRLHASRRLLKGLVTLMHDTLKNSEGEQRCLGKTKLTAASWQSLHWVSEELEGGRPRSSATSRHVVPFYPDDLPTKLGACSTKMHEKQQLCVFKDV